MPLFPWARSVAEAIWEMRQLELRQRAEAQNETVEFREINDSRGSCLASTPIMLCSQCFPASLGGWEEPRNIWYMWAASRFVILVDYSSTKPSCTYKDQLRCSLPSSHCHSSRKSLWDLLPIFPMRVFVFLILPNSQSLPVHSNLRMHVDPVIHSCSPKCYNFFLLPGVVSNTTA